jgi:hypothetical protein
MSRRLVALGLLALGLVALAAAGCGGSSTPQGITVGKARVYRIAEFAPARPIVPGKPTTVSFLIRQPDGKPLTRFKTGPGPHTGVHLIFVRDDLDLIIHHHPPIAKNGTIRDSVTFPKPGEYRLVVDVYPASSPEGSTTGLSSAAGAPQTTYNFQLFSTVDVKGPYKPAVLPPPGQSDTVDGYHFTLSGASHLKAIQAELVHMTVTDPQGEPVTFTPWYGALAHAIFFHRGSLDYFHTHVCAPGATGCASILGATKVTGTSSTPGKLTVGVLVPVPGTWRLFLQCHVGGKVLTAPFTLEVR